MAGLPGTALHNYITPLTAADLAIIPWPLCLQGASEAEWRAAAEAAAALRDRFPDLHEEMSRNRWVERMFHVCNSSSAQLQCLQCVMSGSCYALSQPGAFAVASINAMLCSLPCPAAAAC